MALDGESPVGHIPTGRFPLWKSVYSKGLPSGVEGSPGFLAGSVLVEGVQDDLDGGVARFVRSVVGPIEAVRIAVFVPYDLDEGVNWLAEDGSSHAVRVVRQRRASEVVAVRVRVSALVRVHSFGPLVLWLGAASPPLLLFFLAR